MDFDDLRDFMEQDIHAGQFPTGATGPIAKFLNGHGVPDWIMMNMTPDSEDLNKAFENLPVPLQRQLSLGISVLYHFTVTRPSKV